MKLLNIQCILHSIFLQICVIWERNLLHIIPGAEQCKMIKKNTNRTEKHPAITKGSLEVKTGFCFSFKNFSLMTITQHLYSVNWLESYIEIHFLKKTLFCFFFSLGFGAFPSPEWKFKKAKGGRKETLAQVLRNRRCKSRSLFLNPLKGLA